jgi:competence ComEA-like helix-hairpin-helix protein
MWRDLLALSRREQVAMLVLAVLLIGVIGLLFVNRPVHQKVVDDELLIWADSVRFVATANVSKPKDTVFYFDPNVETVKRLQLLGFSNQAIVNLLKYREAGGRFRSPDKLRTIYGVDSALYQRLEAYIRFEKTHRGGELKEKKVMYPKVSSYSDKPLPQQVVNKPSHKDELMIEINSADTAMFALLKGIGPVLSARIVSYRKKLGGFYSVEQLLEVYGLSEEVLERNRSVLMVDEKLLRPMDISHAGLKQMKNHPYLDFYMAKDIYEVRRAGQLISVEQFRDSSSFVKADMAKLSKYLKVGGETSFDN